jgi:Cu(I)/Ag(I) efflux system protein CusF
MKIQSLLFTLALLAGCSSSNDNANPATPDASSATLPAAAATAAAPATATTTGEATESMPAMTNTATPPPAVPAATTAASATGVVKAVDPVAKTITLDHGAVAALQWPAMIMTFKTGDVDVSSIKPGDHVAFEFTSTGMDGTLTKIDRQ